MKILFKNEIRKQPLVSIILLDWSVRESYHTLYYLNNQIVPREQYEIIWIEYYDRRLGKNGWKVVVLPLFGIISKNRKDQLEENMHKTIEGIYEDGKITLKEIPEFKKSRVMVTFIEETDGHKVFRIIPDIFKNPIKVSEIKKFRKEELHER